MECYFWKKKIIWLLWAVCIVRCAPARDKKKIQYAFYYWKTTMTQWRASERAFLEKMDKSVLYVRLFDVDWDADVRFPKPVSEIYGLNPQDSLFKAVIPTVFITNRTFLNLPDSALDTLASLILEKVRLKMPAVALRQVQFDCDWNVRSRERYFQFLKLVQKKSAYPISATIRLHQIKFYDQTGVPPVQRGILMCYNVTDLDAPSSVNSIADTGALSNYLKKAPPYPLPLDVALPIFSWGVVLRNGQVVQLIHPLRANDAELQNGFLKKNAFIFELKQNMYFKGHYLYKDDEIRIEEVPLAALRKTVELVRPLLYAQDSLSVAYFHLDSTHLSAYPSGDLKKIWDSFYE